MRFENELNNYKEQFQLETTECSFSEEMLYWISYPRNNEELC